MRPTGNDGDYYDGYANKIQTTDGMAMTDFMPIDEND